MKLFLILILVAFIAIYFTTSIRKNLKTEMNSLQIDYKDSDVSSLSIKVAVIGDIHLGEGDDITKFLKLLDEVKSNNPDLVLLVGDYITDLRKIKDVDSHRRNIIKTFKSLDPIPRAIVLGNHDNYTGRKKWFTEFKDLKVDLLENESRIMNVAGAVICVRGLGDFNSHRFKFVDYPKECKNLPKLTITHDPQGAFESGVEGLVFAGHTHCGQVSFPIIGPLKVPSKAPRDATCGLYKDSKRTLFVTSGVGTSILPIRYGAQSNWDLIDLSFGKK